MVYGLVASFYKCRVNYWFHAVCKVVESGFLIQFYCFSIFENTLYVPHLASLENS